MAEAINWRQDPRIAVECGFMYQAQDGSSEVLMGDGLITDLSHHGLGIRGNATVTPGMELTIFLYLPDGQDSLFVVETRVAWTKERRVGVEMLKMNLRERNRLRHFLYSNLAHSD